MKPFVSGSTRRIVVALLLLGAGGAPRAQTNDTGLVTCYNNSASTGTVSAATPNPEPAGFVGQDCTTGAAAADAVGVLYKRGNSSARGFDYTKIANDGSELPVGAVLGSNPADWACTRDNRTGLIWEVKVNNAAHLRHVNHGYTWYDTNPAVNGGNAGKLGVDSDCINTLTNCNTTAFRDAVNMAGLCGASDWRLPAPEELLSLVQWDAVNTTIDVSWFPNTKNSGYWSGVNFAPNADLVWVVYFNGSTSSNTYFKGACCYPVRLVRGGQ